MPDAAPRDRPRRRGRRPTGQVRRAHPHDYYSVLALLTYIHDQHVAAAPAFFKPSSPDLLTREVYAGWLADPDRTILLVEDEEQAVGFAHLVHTRRPETPYSYAQEYLVIDQFGVRYDHQRLGYGRHLMEEIVALASARGLRRLELSVWAFNAGAVAFYERCGFKTYLHRMEMLLPPRDEDGG
jgi:ribosomal protein S18 acetylase RimI-like enzyme